MVHSECDKESPPASRNDKGEDAITDAVSQVMARMHGIEAGLTPLGPVLTSEVKVEGTTTKALLDTGSPVSIISLDVFLQAASAGRTKDQSPDDWGKEVHKHLPTTMSLHSYGGNELPVVAQVSCRLSRGSFSVEGVWQVQKGAPVNLLLGTDTLSQLGFSLTEKTDSTTCTRDILHSGATTLQPTSTEIADVKLIRPAHLRAGHSKLLRVKTSSPMVRGKACVFEPVTQPWGYRGLFMPDAVVEVGNTGETTLVVANTDVESVLLGGDYVMGSLEKCEVVQPGCHKDTLEVCVSAVQTPVLGSEHVEKLQHALKLDVISLPSEEHTQLVSLVMEFVHLFALYDSDLGRTSQVTYHIDTGDSPLIKQLPRRIPFVL